MIYTRILIAGLPDSGVAHFFEQTAAPCIGQSCSYFQHCIDTPDLIFDLFGMETTPQYDFFFEIGTEGMPGGILLVNSDQTNSWPDSLHILEIFRPIPYLIVNTGSTDPAPLLAALQFRPEEKWIACDLQDRASRKVALITAIQHTPPLAALPVLQEKLALIF